MIDQKSIEQAAKESAEKCRIKYGRDFTQAVDMFKRGAEWQSQHCVTDCVKEADTKALEERAAEEAAVEQNILEAEKCCESCKHSAMSDVARTAIVRGFRKGRKYQSQQLPPAQEDLAEKQIHRIQELEAQLAEAKDEYNNVCKFANDYEAQRDDLRAAMRDALEALKFYANVKAWFDNTVDNDAGNIARSALAKLRECLKP